MNATIAFPIPSTSFARVTPEMLAAPIKDSALRVLCVIALHHFNDGAFKDIPQLQREARVSRTVLYRAIHELKENDLLWEANGRFFIQQFCPRSGTKKVVKIPISGPRKSRIWDDHPLYTDKLIPYSEDEPMGKIVGDVRRGNILPLRPDTKVPALRSASLRTPQKAAPPLSVDSRILQCATFFEKLTGRVSASAKDSERWQKMLDIYDTVEEVQAACQRAYDMRGSLRTAKFPVFTLATVLGVYAAYKDATPQDKRDRKEQVENEHATLKEMELRGDISRARKFAVLHGLLRRDMQGIVSSDFLEQVFTESVDATGDRTSENSGAVRSDD